MSKKKAVKKAETKPSYEGIIKEAVTLFMDLMRKGRKVVIPTAANEFKLEGTMFLRSLSDAQRFVNSVDADRPELKLEDVFSININKFEIPNGDVLYTPETVFATIENTIEDHFGELNQQFPNPQDPAQSHPMLNEVLVVLDKLVQMEANMPKAKQKVTLFDLKDNEQVIVTTTSTTIYH